MGRKWLQLSSSSLSIADCAALQTHYGVDAVYYAHQIDAILKQMSVDKLFIFVSRC